MPSRLARILTSLELEERILNAGAIITFVGVACPWISGEWLGADRITFSGFSYFTSFIGFAIALINLFIIAITVVPLIGGPPIIRRRHREFARLQLGLFSSILALAALSVLMRATLEFARMEIRFGMYVTLIGSLLTTLYAALREQARRRDETRDLFHHPEDLPPEEPQSPIGSPPPPPPPPAPRPEDHPTIRL